MKDPRIPETYRQAEGMLASDRVLGIKIHPDLHGYSILEHGDAVENTRYETSMWIPPAGQSEQCTGICGQQGGSEKILFGTDTYSCAFQFGRIALSALSEQDKENILYRNAMRLFPAAF